MAWFWTLLDRLSTKPCLIAIFLFCALPTGLCMALLTPLGQAPDEPAHAARAAGLLHGAVLAARVAGVQPDTGRPITDTGVEINAGLVWASFGATTAIGGRQHVLTEADQAATRSQNWGGTRMFANIPNTATYFPAFYVPAALGLGVGRLLHQSPYRCLLLARLAMLAAFLLAGGAALGLAPFGEALLLAVLILPMTLFLAGSLNADGLLIAASCLGAACLAHDPATHPRRYLPGVCVLVLIVVAKLPYAALLGLLLLPLRRAGLWRRAGRLALAGLPVLLWAALLAAFVAAPFGKPPYHPGPLWAGDPRVMFDRTDPAANLHILLADPARFVILPWHSLGAGGIQKLRETVGVLGLLNLQFPDGFYWSWVAAVLLAALGLLFVRRRAVEAVPPERAWLGGACGLALLVLTFWSIAIAMYLNWTNVGAAAIDGLQGRYYIPLLPFLLFVLPRWRRPAVLPAIVPALPVIAIGVFDLGYLPQQLVQFYYLH